MNASAFGDQLTAPCNTRELATYHCPCHIDHTLLQLRSRKCLHRYHKAFPLGGPPIPCLLNPTYAADEPTTDEPGGGPWTLSVGPGSGCAQQETQARRVAIREALEKVFAREAGSEEGNGEKEGGVREPSGGKLPPWVRAPAPRRAQLDAAVGAIGEADQTVVGGGPPRGSGSARAAA